MQDFLHAVHFQGEHAIGQRLGEQFGDPGMFLDAFLQGVRTQHQFVQAKPPLVAAAFAGRAAFGAGQDKLTVAAVIGEQAGADGSFSRLRVS